MTTIRFDVYHHVVFGDSENPLIKLILSKLETAMALLDDILTKVTAQTTVTDSVVTLLTELKAKLDAAIANGSDPVKLQAISDAIGTNTQKLADGVTTNTPAE